MPRYVLNYFDARGRAEVPRILFNLGNVEFTDNRIADWPATKGDAPLGQLPYLQVDDVKLPQSVAISRYLARVVGVSGRTHLEEAQADAIVDTCGDAVNAYVEKVFHSGNQEEGRKSFIENDLAKHLGNIEKLIALYGQDGYSVGNSLTYADLHVYEFLSQAKPKTDAEKQAQFVSTYPVLARVVQRVEEHPKVGEYLRTRPEAKF